MTEDTFEEFVTREVAKKDEQDSVLRNEDDGLVRVDR